MNKNNKLRNIENIITLHKYSLNMFMFFLIILSSLVLISMNSSNAYALGIAPSREIMEFNTNDNTFTVRIINNDAKDMKVMLYPQGELAQYTELDNKVTIIDIKSTEAEKEFKYKITLPPNLEPGTRSLTILATEIPESTDSTNVVSSTLSVGYQLKVNVPYSGTFAEGIFYISEGNVNSTIVFTANIMNKGTTPINKIDGELVIKGPTNEELYRIKANSLSLNVQETNKMDVAWIANTNPGVYYAEFIINYDGKIMVLRKTFMVGTDSLDVRSINVDSFRLGTIAKLDIDIVNKWNQQVQNVYADIDIIDSSGSKVTSIKTVSTDISPLSSSRLTGYWDTKDLSAGNYDMNVVVNYNGKQVQKLFRTVVGLDSIAINNPSLSVGQVIGSDGKGNSNSLLIILIVVLIVINVGWFVYFKFLKNKGNNPPGS